MKNYQLSYKARKQRRINEICANMRAGKERKRLGRDYTPHPDRPQLCMRVVVHDHECGGPKTTTYFLQACAVRRDSYWIWQGKTRWPKPMGRAGFFRALYDKHPRLMLHEG